MASKYTTPGSFWIEIALWIIFFPAGIIYSLWRWTSRRPVHSVSSPFIAPAPKEGDFWENIVDGSLWRYRSGEWVRVK